ncbi:MAG: hypothetical protein HY815_06665 [Candidatus Riflebacteria bacterium]|nr:hypothetical protein [Candidatus Riflebacteria bacterium]
MDRHMYSLAALTPHRCWLGTVLLLTALSLWPIWRLPCPPLQDYPPHLWLAQVVSSYDQREDLRALYSCRLRPGPYSLFDLLIVGFTRWFSVDVAGRAALSIVVLLTTTLVLVLASGQASHGRAQERTPSTGADTTPAGGVGTCGTAASPGPPWGALVLFPLTFNQQYYLGNINFLLSIPLLLLGLLSQDVIQERGTTPLRAALHGVVLLALFLAHPFTVLAYFGLSVLRALAGRPPARPLLVSAVLPTVLAIGTVLWVALLNGPDPSAAPTRWSVDWLPFRVSAIYLLSMFTGLVWHDGVDGWAVATWTTLGLALAAAAFTGSGAAGGRRDPLRLPLLATALAVFVLPGCIGAFTYINLRLSPVAYFLLGAGAASSRASGPLALLIVTLTATCLAGSLQKQSRLAGEIAEVIPLVTRIPPGEPLLPLVFDRYSPHLDGALFTPHLHVHNYYHLLTGGGWNPYLFRQPFVNCRLKDPRLLVGPGEIAPEAFDWGAHGGPYRYIVVRAAPPAAVGELSKKARLVGTSGRWLLFHKVR